LGRGKRPAHAAFWGDRYGRVTDPFGHEWSIATRNRDLTPEEIKKGAEEFFTQVAKAPVG
jgi:PhnB protein